MSSGRGVANLKLVGVPTRTGAAVNDSHTLQNVAVARVIGKNLEKFERDRIKEQNRLGDDYYPGPVFSDLIASTHAPRIRLLDILPVPSSTLLSPGRNAADYRVDPRTFIVCRRVHSTGNGRPSDSADASAGVSMASLGRNPSPEGGKRTREERRERMCWHGCGRPTAPEFAGRPSGCAKI